MDTRQFREFASAVVRHLPEIESAEAQLLIDKQHRLATILRHAFQKPVLNEFPFTINGDLPLEEAGQVMESLFDNWHEWLNEEWVKAEWPVQGSADIHRTLHFVRFGSVPLTGRQVMIELANRYLRPATFVETSFFIAQYSNMIASYVHADQVVLDLDTIKPLVILDEPRVVAVLQDKEIHGDYLGKLFWPNSVFPAISIT